MPPRTHLLLWFAALGGPVAWALHLVLVYPLVYPYCDTNARAVLDVVNWGTGAVALASGLVGWYFVRRLNTPDLPVPGQRARFMACCGLALGLLFTFIIAVESLPVYLNDPCQLPGEAVRAGANAPGTPRTRLRRTRDSGPGRLRHCCRARAG